MEIFVISEIIEKEDDVAFMTTNNHIKSRFEAHNMFLTRRDMMVKTEGSRIIRDEYSKDENWGFVKVMLESGTTIEVAFGSLSLI